MISSSNATPFLSIPKGHTLMLDGDHLRQLTRLQVGRGLIRVAFTTSQPNGEATAPITLGFLKTGDPLSLELLRHSWLHLEALEACCEVATHRWRPIRSGSRNGPQPC
jgi:hypothetical protein